MEAPACAILSLTDWCPQKNKNQKRLLKSKESAHVRNKNSNIEKVNSINCDDWAAERAAPPSQQPHLLSENYLSHYVHVHFEIPGHPGGENVARLLESKILGCTIIPKKIWTQTKIIQGPIKKKLK